MKTLKTKKKENGAKNIKIGIKKIIKKNYRKLTIEAQN